MHEDVQGMQAKTTAITNMPYRKASSSAIWAKRQYRPSIEDLHHQVDDLYQYLMPKPDEYCMRQSALARISCVLSWVFPDARISLYGSVANGLYLPHSDLDITVEWPMKRGIPDLTTLAKFLKLTGFYQDIKVIEKAAVPLVKLVEVSTQIHIDVSFNVQNFYLVITWIQTTCASYPLANQLVIAIKQFLHVNKLNNPYNGGLPSYTLVVMVMHFLKTVDLESLPPRIQANPLGALLLMFFDYYGNKFDYTKYALAFGRNNEPLIIEKTKLASQENTFACPSMLTIVDPVNPENDLGRGAYNMLMTKHAFMSAVNFLRNSLVAEDNDDIEEDDFEEFNNVPVLSCCIPVPIEDVKSRDNASRNFTVFNSPYASRVLQ